MIAAEGEQKASRALREASQVIQGSAAALQLRYLQVRSLISIFKELFHFSLTLNLFMELFYFLQTLNNISAEKNSTIIFPLPIDMLSHFTNKKMELKKDV